MFLLVTDVSFVIYQAKKRKGDGVVEPSPLANVQRVLSSFLSPSPLLRKSRKPII